jgi:hypothetical protein
MVEAPHGHNFVIPLTKIDVERRLVIGTAAQEVPDKANEIMDYASAKPAFEKWSSGYAAATGGLSKGNLRVMHTKHVAGKFDAVEFDDDNKRIQVIAKVIDDNEWKKCLEGAYTGFSVGGGYAKRWDDPDNPGMKRYTPDIREISLVDNPCIPTARFAELVKADGLVEELTLVGRVPTFAEIWADRPRSFDEVMKSAPKPAEDFLALYKGIGSMIGEAAETAGASTANRVGQSVGSYGVRAARSVGAGLRYAVKNPAKVVAHSFRAGANFGSGVGRGVATETGMSERNVRRAAYIGAGAGVVSAGAKYALLGHEAAKPVHHIVRAWAAHQQAQQAQQAQQGQPGQVSKIEDRGTLRKGAIGTATSRALRTIASKIDGPALSHAWEKMAGSAKPVKRYVSSRPFLAGAAIGAVATHSAMSPTGVPAYARTPDPAPVARVGRDAANRGW